MIWEISQSWLASAGTPDAKKKWLTKVSRYSSDCLHGGNDNLILPNSIGMILAGDDGSPETTQEFYVALRPYD
jgi:hypothetical protein